MTARQTCDWYKGAWYRIWDHIASFPYFVPAMHLRPILPDEIRAHQPGGAVGTKTHRREFDEANADCLRK